MNSNRLQPGVSSKIATILLAVAVFAGMVWVVLEVNRSQPVEAVVRDVVNGESVDVTSDGKERTVKILNLATPLSAQGQSACLAEQSKQAVAELLPKRSGVNLVFDRQRVGEDGRYIAGIRTDEGSQVGVEVARKGLGIAVEESPNNKFYSDIQRAQREAEKEKIGLFSPDIECTIPGRVKDLENRVSKVIPPNEKDAKSTDVASLTTNAAHVTGVANELADLLKEGKAGIIWDALSPTQKQEYRNQVDTLQRTITTRHHELEEMKPRVEEREKREREEAEKAQQEELARQQALAQQHAEEAARLQAEAQRQAAQQQAQQPTQTTATQQPTPQQSVQTTQPRTESTPEQTAAPQASTAPSEEPVPEESPSAQPSQSAEPAESAEPSPAASAQPDNQSDDREQTADQPAENAGNSAEPESPEQGASSAE